MKCKVSFCWCYCALYYLTFVQINGLTKCSVHRWDKSPLRLCFQPNNTWDRLIKVLLKSVLSVLQQNKAASAEWMYSLFLFKVSLLMGSKVNFPIKRRSKKLRNNQTGQRTENKCAWQHIYSPIILKSDWKRTLTFIHNIGIDPDLSVGF